MKRIAFTVTLIAIAMLSACKKRNKEVRVVRDCTGTYLRFNEKDYQVCNLEKVASYSNGANVTATFKKIEECNGSANDVIVCAMYHPNEGWIEVESIE